MSNGATIVFKQPGQREGTSEFSPPIHIRWNGGPESVYAFVEALANYTTADREKFDAENGKAPPTELAATSIEDATARFTQLVGNFMGTTGTLYVMPEKMTQANLAKLDHDTTHGTYVVNAHTWEIDRISARGQGFGNPSFEQELEREAKMVSAHPYWTPKNGEATILQTIRARNDEAFLTTSADQKLSYPELPLPILRDLGLKNDRGLPAVSLEDRSYVMAMPLRGKVGYAYEATSVALNGKAEVVERLPLTGRSPEDLAMQHGDLVRKAETEGLSLAAAKVAIDKDKAKGLEQGTGRG